MLAGSFIALLMFPLVILNMDAIDDYLFNSPYTPLFVVSLTVFLLYIYPVDQTHWSKDRGDTAAILGVGMGVVLGHYVSGPSPDDFEEGPFALTLPSIQLMSLCIVRFVVGLLLLLPTRFTMKLLCFKLLPMIMPTHGVEETVKRPLVELPYKVITYGAIGFNAVYLSHVVFEICGVSRWK